MLLIIPTLVSRTPTRAAVLPRRGMIGPVRDPISSIIVKSLFFLFLLIFLSLVPGAHKSACEVASGVGDGGTDLLLPSPAPLTEPYLLGEVDWLEAVDVESDDIHQLSGVHSVELVFLEHLFDGPDQLVGVVHLFERGEPFVDVGVVDLKGLPIVVVVEVLVDQGS